MTLQAVREYLLRGGFPGGGMASIQRSLLIEAPISASFSFWSDFERYPAFMEDVARVRLDHADLMTRERRKTAIR
jgi:hypothetical protein